MCSNDSWLYDTQIKGKGDIGAAIYMYVCVYSIYIHTYIVAVILYIQYACLFSTFGCVKNKYICYFPVYLNVYIHVEHEADMAARGQDIKNLNKRLSG